MPRPQPRARPSRRPRRTLEAKCSCATDASPRCQRSPSSWRYGRTTSVRNGVDRRDARAARRSTACARGSSKLVERGGELAPRRSGATAGRAAPAAAAGRETSAAASAAARPCREVLAASAARARGRPASRAGARPAERVGPQQPVPAFPRAQQLRADARAPAQLADPEQSRRPWRHYTTSRQHLDKRCRHECYAAAILNKYLDRR